MALGAPKAVLNITVPAINSFCWVTDSSYPGKLNPKAYLVPASTATSNSSCKNSPAYVFKRLLLASLLALIVAAFLRVLAKFPVIALEKIGAVNLLSNPKGALTAVPKDKVNA